MGNQPSLRHQRNLYANGQAARAAAKLVANAEPASAALSSKQSAEKFDDVLKIHEYERQRLGQELHDSTGQLVISLGLGLARLRNIAGLEWQKLVDDIQATVSEIDREIRSMAFLHFPAELANRSLSASLASLAAGFGRRTGVDTSFESTGHSPHLDDSVSSALLRVAQEALVNVHRHSQAQSAKVELKNKSHQIELIISDDGVGMAANAGHPSGIGVSGMRHRIESNGGHFEIRDLNPGTMIRATIPV